jgi:hypothetical protein
MTLEPPAVVLAPDDFRAEIARRLKDRRGDRSITSTGASGVGSQIVARLEVAGDQNVMLAHLYHLAEHYGCSLGGLLDPNRDVPGTWPERAPSYEWTDSYVRQQLRAIRLGAELGTKALAAEVAKLEPPVSSDLGTALKKRRAAGERYVRLTKEFGIGLDQARRICSGRPLVAQSWLVRIESGEVVGLDVVRLTLVCAALKFTIVDLLPPILRGRTQA